MNTSNDILDKNWQELILAFETGLIKDLPDVEIEYRIYYNDKGEIISTTMVKGDKINQDLPSIIVDKEIYNNSNKFEVVNGQVKLRYTSSSQKVVYVKKENGNFKTMKNNLAILVEDNDNIKQVDTYGPRSS